MIIVHSRIYLTALDRENFRIVIKQEQLVTQEPYLDDFMELYRGETGTLFRSIFYAIRESSGHLPSTQ